MIRDCDCSAWFSMQPLAIGNRAWPIRLRREKRAGSGTGRASGRRTHSGRMPEKWAAAAAYWELCVENYALLTLQDGSSKHDSGGVETASSHAAGMRALAQPGGGGGRRRDRARGGQASKTADAVAVGAG